MVIEKEKYDQLPFAIRTGALLLWGTLLSSYWEAEHLHQLYSFSGFYAEMLYNLDQQAVAIQTFWASRE